MLEVCVPGRGSFEYQTAVFDFNGTLADGGKLVPGLADRLCRLSEHLKLYVLTADTFGHVREEMAGLPIEVVVLSEGLGGSQKESFVRRLGCNHCVAFGNGANDASMLSAAGLGIAVLGPEGAAKQTLSAADIVVRDINDGIDLLLDVRRLIATLRL